MLNLSLIGTEINHESKNTFSLQNKNSKYTVYFNLLHSSFSNNRSLNNSKGIHLVFFSNRSSLILRLTSKNQSVRTIEMNLSVNLTNSLLLSTLNFLGSSSSYIIVRNNSIHFSHNFSKTIHYLDFPSPFLQTSP